MRGSIEKVHAHLVYPGSFVFTQLPEAPQQQFFVHQVIQIDELQLSLLSCFRLDAE